MTYRQEGIYENLTSESEILVFRIFQEALNNIIRHAGAASIDVFFKCTPHWIDLTIVDDGKGFDVNKMLEKQKLLENVSGLNSMQKRAGLINAQISIESNWGVGSRISLKVPINNLKNE